MTKYREILRLKSLGFSDRNIAQSCGVSRNTVRRVIDKAEEMKISWPLDFGMTDAALGELLFPTEKSVTDWRLPDYSYIRKELLRMSIPVGNPSLFRPEGNHPAGPKGITVPE